MLKKQYIVFYLIPVMVFHGFSIASLDAVVVYFLCVYGNCFTYVIIKQVFANIDKNWASLRMFMEAPLKKIMSITENHPIQLCFHSWLFLCEVMLNRLGAW